MARRYIQWVPSPKTLKQITRIHVKLFRLSRGLVGSRLDGMDVLLMTSTGRKSGVQRTVPLPYFRDGERYVVVGSNGGGPKNPAWYHNVKSTPQVTVEIGRRSLPMHAEVLSGEDRDRVWQAIVAEQPRYAGYQQKTTRQIPLVALSVR